MSLTARQQRFVDEYLVDLNATKAAIRAGYAESSARRHASALMTKPDIMEAIASRRSEIAKTLHVTQEAVVAEYAKIAFSSLADAARWGEDSMSAIPSDELDPATRAAVKSVTIRTTTTTDRKSDRETVRVEHRIEMHNKLGALDSLARHLGMFVDRISMTVGGEERVRQLVELGATEEEARAAIAEVEAQLRADRR